MRNYIILFFLLSVFLFACKDHSVPKGIIPEEKMIALLTNVHLVDGTMYNYPQSGDSLYYHGMGRYLQLFKKFKTDTLQFKKSMQYYTAQPRFDAMYDQILLNLSAKTDSLNNIKKIQARADSVKNVAKFKATQDSIKRAGQAKK